MKELYTTSVTLIPLVFPLYIFRFSLLNIPTNIPEAAVAAVLLLGASRADVRNQWRRSLRTLPRPVLFGVAAFIAAAVISAGVSPHPSTSLGILKGWVLAPVLFAWLVYCHGRRGFQVGNTTLEV